MPNISKEEKILRKFFVEPNQIKDNKIEIIGEDINHIKNVLRLEIGEEIKIGDKLSGENYITQIESISKENIICKVLEKIGKSTEGNVELAVFQGLPKADKMELIIQKGTELGVTTIVPVQFKRSIVKLSRKR